MALVTMGDAASPAAQPALTMAGAADALGQAVEFGRLVAQQAPAGHPINDAVANAAEGEAWFRDQVPWYSSTGPIVAPGTNTYATMQGLIDAIYTEAATVTTSPDQPPPLATWTAPATPFSWWWVAGGAAVAGAAALAYRRRKR